MLYNFQCIGINDTVIVCRKIKMLLSLLILVSTILHTCTYIPFSLLVPFFTFLFTSVNIYTIFLLYYRQGVCRNSYFSRVILILFTLFTLRHKIWEYYMQAAPSGIIWPPEDLIFPMYGSGFVFIDFLFS